MARGLVGSRVCECVCVCVCARAWVGGCVGVFVGEGVWVCVPLEADSIQTV